MELKEKTIDEMNIVIADFMGYYYQCSKFYPKSGGSGNWFKYAQYHHSWNELIKVYGKFKELIIGFIPLVMFNEYRSSFLSAVDNNNIVNAHKAIYDAVIWYKSKING